MYNIEHILKDTPYLNLHAPIVCTFCEYSQVPLISHNTSDTAITMTESESPIRITRDTPCLALTSELWGVYCKDLWEN